MSWTSEAAFGPRLLYSASPTFELHWGLRAAVATHLTTAKPTWTNLRRTIRKRRVRKSGTLTVLDKDDHGGNCGDITRLPGANENRAGRPAWR